MGRPQTRQPLAVFKGHRIYSKRYADNFDKIVDVYVTKSQKAFLVRCQTSDCQGTFKLLDLLSGLYKHCRPCRDKARTRHGRPVLQTTLDQIDDFVVSIRQKPRTGKPDDGGNLYTVKCSAQPCDSTREFNSLKAATAWRCQTCWAKGRRKAKWRRHYNFVRARAQRFDLPFALNFEWFQKFMEHSSCFYCGVSVEREAYPISGKNQSMACHIDRIDSDAGYTHDNITSCCWPCNKNKRSAFTARQWLVVAAMRQNKDAEAKRYIDCTDEQIRQMAIEHVQ